MAGALDLEVVAVELVEVQQRPDDQRVDRHLHRPAPLGVSPEHPRVQLLREVLHPELLPVDGEDVRVPLVELGKRPHPIGTQEFGLVEPPREERCDDRHGKSGKYHVMCQRHRSLGATATARLHRAGIVTSDLPPTSAPVFVSENRNMRKLSDTLDRASRSSIQNHELR